MRRGVAVATRDRHAGLCKSELRTDNMHDALVVAERAVGTGQGNAEFAAVLLERDGHLFRDHVEKRTAAAVGRYDVVDGGEGAIGKCDVPPVLAQHVERLRAGDFVNQVQSDEQLRLSARQRAHFMCVPHLVKKRVSHVTSNDSGRMRR